MPLILKSEAICLHSAPWRETSKVTTFFTREHGKLILRAKGARRPKSKFGAGLEIFTHSRIIFYVREGRQIDTLSDVEIIEDFPRLRSDQARLRAGAVALEFTNRSFEVQAANPAVFNLLLSGLRLLDARHGDYSALVFAYMFKSIGRIGYEPRLSHCLACHRPKAAAFSPRRGGLLCSNCVPVEPDALRVNAPILRRLRLLYYGSLEQNLRHHLLPEVRAMVMQYLQFHLERFELKSLRFLV